MSAFYSLSDDEDGPTATSSAMRIDGAEGRSQPRISHSQSPSTTGEPAAITSPFSRRRTGPGAPDFGSADLTPPRNRRQTSPSLSTVLGAGAAASSGVAGPPVPRPAIERLQRIWVSERCAPELMPWSDPGSRWRCDEVVDEVCAQVEQQNNILSLLSADENTSEEEHLRLSLVQLDVERTKWLIRAFLRTRIHKVEANAQYYLSLPSQRLSILLSPLEVAYAKKYTSIRNSHLSASVLDYLPEGLRGLTDEYGEGGADGPAAGNGMVTRPDVQQPVFIQCLEDCGSLDMPDGEPAALSQGSIHILSYARISHLVRQGRAVLV
ncbi:unnamed protein product [Parajaminaea phylloscopi]